MHRQFTHRHSISHPVAASSARDIARTGGRRAAPGRDTRWPRDTTFRTTCAIRLAVSVAAGMLSATVAPPPAEVGNRREEQPGAHDLRLSNMQRLPGELACAEGASATGEAVDEVYDGPGATYDFYWETLRRNSTGRDQGCC